MGRLKCFGAYDAVTPNCPCRRCPDFWECKLEKEAPKPEKAKRGRKKKEAPVEQEESEKQELE